MGGYGVWVVCVCPGCRRGRANAQPPTLHFFPKKEPAKLISTNSQSGRNLLTDLVLQNLVIGISKLSLHASLIGMALEKRKELD